MTGTARRYDMMKTTIDMAISAILLIFLLPVFAIIGILVSRDGGPVFFCQTRLGRFGQPFRVIKFRTMAVDADARLTALLDASPDARLEWSVKRKLTRDPRITRAGGLLRRSSLDELPQLINVLRGEMSLVGPRPIVADEAARLGCRLGGILSVKPGITGLWQINGRNDVTYFRRVALESVYARHRTVLLDLYILLMTPLAVVRARGAY